ncbi:MAG: M24 family metallopeptidase [Phycisphaerae bacterium]
MSSSATRPPDYIQQRWQAAQTQLKKSKAAALLVSYYPDVSWLTGFEGEDSWALLTADSVCLISDFRYGEQIARECPWVNAVMRKRQLSEELIKICKRLTIRNLAVQEESLTLRQHAAIQGFTKPVGIRVQPVVDFLVALRNIKDAHEIALIEQAITIAERGFETLKAHLETGQTENEIAGLLVYEMRRRGAANASFDPIVAVGPNGSLPHYRPGAVKLLNKSPLLVDWGALFSGYRADLTRMIFIGDPPRKIREIYQIVLAAQEAAIAAIRPGVSGRKIDKIARDIITQAGYGKMFGHSLGHGIGRDIHEAISLSQQSDVILQAGMVVTVEPGIYLPGVGGVRIEDDILVTERGYRVLSTLPKTLNAARL